MSERLLHVELPMDPDSAAAGRLLVGELADDLPAHTIADIALLTHELIMNGVRFGAGSGGSVTLSIERNSDRVRVEVCDEGGGFPSGPGESKGQGAGLGLRFVDALADHWGVDSADRTRVWFELALPRSQAPG